MRNPFAPFVISAACALCLTGCTSLGSSKKTDNVIDALKALSSNPTVSQVQDAFDLLLKTTVEDYDYAFELKETYTQKTPAVQDGAIAMQEHSQTTYITSFMSDSTLYEVIRTQASAQEQETISLGRIDQKATTWVICNTDQPETFDQQSVSVTIASVAQADNVSLENLSEEEVQNSLLSMQYSLLRTAFGVDASAAPYYQSGYYTFSLNQQGSGYAFTMTLKDLDSYNKNVVQGSVVSDAQDIKTVSSEFTLYLNEKGAMTSYEAFVERSMTLSGMETSSQVIRSGSLASVPAGTIPAVVRDFFAALDDRVYAQQSSLELELPLIQS